MKASLGQVSRAMQREDFLCFLMMCMKELAPGESFLPNWHLEAIDWLLQRIYEGECTRLIVTIPPRSLKSVMISVAWVAWHLGRDPTLKFITVSYAQELALKHARDCRKVMQSDWYKELFPETKLVRFAEGDLVTSRGGGRFSTSVGGALTGVGGDVIIIDDPIKPEDAQSQVLRKACTEWFASTLSSRLDNKESGSILLVMQRVHADDLAGQLLEAGGWDDLNLPAIAQEDERVQIGPGRFHERKAGDALHPARESLGTLEAQKKLMGSSLFSAQYLQNPVPAEGALIRRDWLKRYLKSPAFLPRDLLAQSWDCASKTGVLNDYSVCITALIRKKDVYILDVYRDRLLFPDLKKKAIELAPEQRAKVLLIEDAASGAQLCQTLQRDAHKGVPPPIPIKPDGDKVTRLSGVSNLIEAGKLVLPSEAPWLADFETELLSFPQGRFDDQVDALSQLLGWSAARPVLPNLDFQLITRGPDNPSFYDEFDPDIVDPWNDPYEGCEPARRGW